MSTHLNRAQKVVLAAIMVAGAITAQAQPAAAASCGVVAYTPGNNYAVGLPHQVWGRGVYHCNTGSGSYTLRVELLWNGAPVPTVTRTYSIGSRSSWSPEYFTYLANCSAGGYSGNYQTRITLIIAGHLDPSSTSSKYPACG